VETAIASLDDALARHPSDPVALSNRLMAAQYRPGVTAADLAKLHRVWDERIGDALRPAQERHAVTRRPEGPLRVGIVSADLRMHPAGFFVIRPIEEL